ncbi:MAG: hypothetical protein AAF830_15930 [Pseudomonadota bacterium]
MAKRVAVAVIHGVGAQVRKDPMRTDQLSFSRGLHNKIRGELGGSVMQDQIAWREIFWSDILQERQDQYFSAIRNIVRVGRLRRLVVSNFADALAFTRKGAAYDELNRRIVSVLHDLKGDCPSDTPLVILAHSFGGRIMSNYIYDLQQGIRTADTAFERCETTARFVTFGCNLPLFTFSYPEEELEPIRYPGTSLPDEFRGEPWWANYYDRDDLLAYPIAPIGPKYQALADRGELAETQINVGGLFSSWNTLSHNEYWTSPAFYQPVSGMLKRLLTLL